MKVAGAADIMNEKNNERSDYMINYANEKIEFNGCPGCAYAKHEFELPCGMEYENENFVLSQDWELPIPGFFIVSPKRCIDRFEELSTEENIKKISEITNLVKENF